MNTADYHAAIRSEIVRCYELSKDAAKPESVRATYLARAKRMARHAADLFWHRAYPEQIEASARIIARDMKDAPRNVPACTQAQWESAWKGLAV